jgi:regulator of PEP synthase PpsR (kinase-PPPase family)
LPEDYRKIKELLGLEMDDEAVRQLRETRQDRKNGNKDAYVDLDAI